MFHTNGQKLLFYKYISNYYSLAKRLLYRRLNIIMQEKIERKTTILACLEKLCKPLFIIKIYSYSSKISHHFRKIGITNPRFNVSQKNSIYYFVPDISEKINTLCKLKLHKSMTVIMLQSQCYACQQTYHLKTIHPQRSMVKQVFPNVRGYVHKISCHKYQCILFSSRR